MFQSKRLLFFAFLFLCLNTFFAAATVEGEESKPNKKGIIAKLKSKKKAHSHHKCDVTKHHHHHEHEPLEINLEQELKAVYIYKILGNHAIWNSKNVENGIKIAMIGEHDKEMLEKMKVLSEEASRTELPFVVHIWDKTKSLNLSEYHAIFIGKTESQLFHNIAQIAYQNDIITFSTLEDEKVNMIETTIQFLVINNKLKFSLQKESVGHLIEEELWKKSYKM